MLSDILRQTCFVFLWCGAALALGGRDAPDAHANPSSNIPVAAHKFQPPLPQWIKEINYLKDEGDGEGYMVVAPADRDPAFKQYHLEYRYFKNAQDQKAERFCKILQFSPQGYLEEDDEIVGNDQYVRDLYADGSVSAYTHDNLISRYFARTVDGFSVSPIKHTVTSLTAGTGDLIYWGNSEATFNHVWYLNGSKYLTVKYDAGICREKRLSVPTSSLNDIYVWTSAKETLETHGEYWTKLPGQPPFACVFVQANNPINRRIRQRLQTDLLTLVSAKCGDLSHL